MHFQVAEFPDPDVSNTSSLDAFNTITLVLYKKILGFA